MPSWATLQTSSTSAITPVLDLESLSERTLGSDHTLDDIAIGTLTLCNRRTRLGSPIGWHAPETALARYELQYWDWADPFIWYEQRTEASSLLDRVVGHWQGENPFGSKPAWEPYTASRRAWSFLKLRHAFWETEPTHQLLEAELHRHLEYLRRNLELDLGGNHLIANLKAVVACATFLGEKQALNRSVALLRDQVQVQILGDGGHFERSPSYHVDVLNDMLDIAHVLERGKGGVPRWLDDAIASMRMWLRLVRMPDGGLPLFHDSRQIPAGILDRLCDSETARSAWLESSRYFVGRTERAVVVIDGGGPGTSTLPGHGHASALSFELYVDGQRIIVDPGCSTYEPGSTRDEERSTTAHNTVALDGANQTEMWGAFRVGRSARIEILAASESDQRFSARHTGYQRLDGAPTHTRTVQLHPDHLEVVDKVDGDGVHEVASRLVLGPQISICQLSEHQFDVGVATISIETEGATTIEPASAAIGMNQRASTSALRTSTTGQLPMTMTTRIRWSA